MKKLLFLVLSTCSLQLDASAQSKPLKVFILAGQSNMEGQGVVSMDGERDYNGGKGNLVWSLTSGRQVPVARSVPFYMKMVEEVANSLLD